MKKKFLAVMLVATMTLSLCACDLLSKNEEPKEEQIVQEEDVQEKEVQEEPVEKKEVEEVASDENAEVDENADKETSGTVSLADAKAGDIVVFGQYEQDGDGSNGSEPIEWEVLEVSGNRALLISRYVLDCKPYNEQAAAVTWETCTLRTWLNGDFYNTAFNDDEKSKIPEVTLSNPDNDFYGGIEGGNDTNDKVFLLSVEEILKYYGGDWYNADNGYGFCDRLVISATQVAKDNGAYTRDNGSLWWLRSPGLNSNRACDVYEDGCVGWDYSSNVHERKDGVRPAIYVEY